MSTPRPRIDRDTAEHLLLGMTAAAQAGTEPLPTLLAAATAPAQPDELRGRQAAMAAFRAHHATAQRPRNRSMLKIALAKLLTVKAGIIAAAATAGGIALAAGTVVIPNHLGDGPQTTPTPSHATGRASGPAGANASPAPSLQGLCQQITAMPADTRSRALDSPAFRALRTAAGSKDDITSFCEALPDATPAGKPTTGPGRAPSAKPSTPTSGAPSRLPNPKAGTPTARPSGAPASPSPRH